MCTLHGAIMRVDQVSAAGLKAALAAYVRLEWSNRRQSWLGSTKVAETHVFGRGHRDDREQHDDECSAHVGLGRVVLVVC